MDRSAKIRILVTHEYSKFLVLICPEKTIKDLKNELIKTYQTISSGGLLPRSLSTDDDLQLLAYDGHVLCENFLVCDSLYDGCMVNTSTRNSTCCSGYSSFQRCCCRHQVLAPTASFQATCIQSYYSNLMSFPPNVPYISSLNYPLLSSDSNSSSSSDDKQEDNKEVPEALKALSDADTI